jgi:hypothetical protein
MLQSLSRHERRKFEKLADPAIVDALFKEFIAVTFKPKPRLMPKFVWRFVVGIVVRKKTGK